MSPAVSAVLNDAAQQHPRQLRCHVRTLAKSGDRALRAFPGLCSDIHLLGRKSAERRKRP
jgi:hypothetical protein